MRLDLGDIPRQYCRQAFLPEGENRKCKSSPGCMLIPTRLDVKCRRIMAAARVIVPIFRMYVSMVDISRGGGLRRCSTTVCITELRGFAYVKFRIVASSSSSSSTSFFFFVFHFSSSFSSFSFAPDEKCRWSSLCNHET